jgi:hypothetical protein
MQYIFDSLNCGNSQIRGVAISCLDKMADYDGRKDHIDDNFSSLGKERRFITYNKDWAELMNFD